MAQDFHDLLVWQRSIELSVAVYELTKLFPKEEIYGITSQLRRASVSVASNIAEGRGRLNGREFRQFLGLAQGSNYEVQTQLVIARHMKFGSAKEIDLAEELSKEVGRMLSSFIAKISAKS